MQRYCSEFPFQMILSRRIIARISPNIKEEIVEEIKASPMFFYIATDLCGIRVRKKECGRIICILQFTGHHINSRCCHERSILIFFNKSTVGVPVMMESKSGLFGKGEGQGTPNTRHRCQVQQNVIEMYYLAKLLFPFFF